MYLNKLANEIYGQPPDKGHQKAINDVIARWIAGKEHQSVLDVGCGQGQALKILKKHILRTVGVTLGEDAKVCKEQGLDVYEVDMSFLPFEDNEFDLIFARHVLEHSPMPLITLMEWHRVSKHLLCLILPTHAHYGAGGANHYYVLLPDQWHNLLLTAGWEVIWTDASYENKVPWEHRWMCQKKGV